MLNRQGQGRAGASGEGSKAERARWSESLAHWERQGAWHVPTVPFLSHPRRLNVAPEGRRRRGRGRGGKSISRYKASEWGAETVEIHFLMVLVSADWASPRRIDILTWSPFSACLHPNLLFFKGHQSYGFRAHLNDFILTVKTLFPNTVTF